MSKKLLDKMISTDYNKRLDSLREKIYSTLFDEVEFYIVDLIKQVQTIKLNYEDLNKISDENLIFYFNYNINFAMKKIKMLPYINRIEILNRFLNLDLSKDENIISVSDFLQWSFCCFYKDKDLAKLMQYFCDNIEYKKSNLIFDLYSIYMKLPDESKCKQIIINKYNEIQKYRKDKLKSRIIL